MDKSDLPPLEPSVYPYTQGWIRHGDKKHCTVTFKSPVTVKQALDILESSGLMKDEEVLELHASNGIPDVEVSRDWTVIAKCSPISVAIGPVGKVTIKSQLFNTDLPCKKEEARAALEYHANIPPNAEIYSVYQDEDGGYHLFKHAAPGQTWMLLDVEAWEKEVLIKPKSRS